MVIVPVMVQKTVARVPAIVPVPAVILTIAVVSIHRVPVRPSLVVDGVVLILLIPVLAAVTALVETHLLAAVIPTPLHVALQGNVIGIYRGMERGRHALTNSIIVYHYLSLTVDVTGAALMAVRAMTITVVAVPVPVLFKMLRTCEMDRHFTKENL